MQAIGGYAFMVFSMATWEEESVITVSSALYAKAKENTEVYLDLIVNPPLVVLIKFISFRNSRVIL